MRVVLTGGGGFIGRHLSHFLQKKGAQVHFLSTRRDDPPFQKIRDVDDAAGIRVILDRLVPDLLFHLAGATSGASNAELNRINVVFARTLLRAVDAMALSCAVVVLGSAAEYGDQPPQLLPTPEDAPCRPVNAYGRSKLEQTRLALEFAHQGLSVVVARPFNILGPGMSSHALLPKLVASIDQAKRLSAPCVPLYLPNATRDYVDVQDLVAVLFALAQSPDAMGRIVNICSGVETSAQALFSVVARVLDADVLPGASSEAPAAGILRSVGAKALMERLSGLRVKTPLETSVQRVVATVLPGA